MLSSNLINIVINYVGYNPLITFECKFLNENLDKLDWKKLSENDYIPYNFWKDHKDKIVWPNFCYRNDMPLEFVKDHLDELDWVNSEFPEDFIEKCLLDDNLKKKINFSDLCIRDDLLNRIFRKTSR